MSFELALKGIRGESPTVGGIAHSYLVRVESEHHQRLNHLEASFSAASFCAVARASAAGTFTSGSTPVPSQLVLEMGLMARASGFFQLVPDLAGLK